MFINNTVIRSLAVMAIAATAAASQALSFTTEQIGNFTSTTSAGATTFSSTFNVFATQSNPSGTNFYSGVFSYSEATPSTTTGTPFSGTFTLYGATMADFLTYSVAGDIFTGTAASESLAGSAKLTASGGAYGGFTSGGGNLSTQILTLSSDGKGGRSGTTFGAFSSDVSAVPEPASMAALGFGIVGLIARRRRA